MYIVNLNLIKQMRHLITRKKLTNIEILKYFELNRSNLKYDNNYTMNPLPLILRKTKMSWFYLGLLLAKANIKKESIILKSKNPKYINGLINFISLSKSAYYLNDGQLMITFRCLPIVECLQTIGLKEFYKGEGLLIYPDSSDELLYFICGIIEGKNYYVQPEGDKFIHFPPTFSNSPAMQSLLKVMGMCVDRKLLLHTDYKISNRGINLSRDLSANFILNFDLIKAQFLL